jgi:hypothetical protein
MLANTYPPIIIIHTCSAMLAVKLAALYGIESYVAHIQPIYVI